MEKKFQLYEFVQSAHTVHCDICQREEIVQSDDGFDASEYFYETGWRARKRCYCPKCAEQLKNKD